MKRPKGTGLRITTILVAMVVGVVAIILVVCIGLFLDRYRSAMVQNARVLVMDEPTANLDCGNSALVMERVSALAGEGFTVIFSTHDPNQAFRYATQVLALQGGSVLAAGRPEEALTSETLTKLYGVGMAVCPVTAAGKSFSVAVVTGGKTQ